MSTVPVVDPARTIRALKAVGVDPDNVASVEDDGFRHVDGSLVLWPSHEAGERVMRAWRRDVNASLEAQAVAAADAVNHPAHYTSDPSGVECITITRHRNFDIGNAFKYLWRAGLKSDASQSPIEKQIEDLDKAIFYIEDEKKRLLAGGGAA